jgi:hypothetical protein
MKTQQPATGIMQMGEWRDARCFRVACDCGTREHEVDAWIEVQDQDRTVSVTFYAQLQTPFQNFGQRLRMAWAILTRGVYSQEHDLILNEQAARNFTAAIDRTLENFQRQ